MRRPRVLPAGMILALILTALLPIAGPIAMADSLSEGFDGFALGTPNGQAGWQATGSAGSGCALYDHAIVDNTYGIPEFGAKSLRMSNAVTSGCFGDHTFSASLADAAGESAAEGGLVSSAPVYPHFEAQWQFASTLPGAEQPGLSVVASPDRGDGARMSWIQMTDTATGLAVNFYDYRDEHVVGTSLGDPNGKLANDDFFFSPVATGLDRTAVHTIKVTMDFLEGPRNDVVRVWVDGVLSHVDTSWEDYFRYEEGNPTRTVDSILFRTGGSAVPATAGNGFLIDNLTLSSGPSTVEDSDGTWELYPEQSVETTTDTTTDTVYRSRVRPPINADGSSNFPKKRGVIPVQFDLDAATATTVTTTTVTGPVVFESILSDNPGTTDNDYSYLSFGFDDPIRFADLDELVADYDFTTGDCGGGALRWSVQIDLDGDGSFSGSPAEGGTDGRIFVYYGDNPNFTSCDGLASQSGVNLVGSSDARFDATQLGGPWYGTYADMLALYGEKSVLRASLALDGGWTAAGDQVVELAGASVDGATWAPLNEGTVIDEEVTTGDFARTCALPEAKLRWVRTDPTPDGAINEASSIQPKDTGEFYRIVDCKYIYNLDVSSIGSLAGTYYVWTNIGGTNVSLPARFDLR